MPSIGEKMLSFRTLVGHSCMLTMRVTDERELLDLTITVWHITNERSACGYLREGGGGEGELPRAQPGPCDTDPLVGWAGPNYLRGANTSSLWTPTPFSTWLRRARCRSRPTGLSSFTLPCPSLASPQMSSCVEAMCTTGVIMLGQGVPRAASSSTTLATWVRL